MKKLIFIIVSLIILIGCSKQKHQFTLSLENHTKDTLKAEIYNIWTGLTDSTINIVPGKQKLILDTFATKTFYINKYPERTLFIWEKAEINIHKESISTDSLNEAVNDHQLWTQQIATGQEETKFKWPSNISNHRYIKEWIHFDNMLFKLFNDSTYRLKQNALNDYRLEKYPAAYMFLHKYTENSVLWITQHVKNILSKIEYAGITPNVEKYFLSLYFNPLKVNLRTDSTMHALSKFAPEIYSRLENLYKKRRQKAKIKNGDKFPIITGTSPARDKVKINFDTRYTLIDFWATWCIPCVKQMPELNSHAKKYPKHLKIISISVDSKKDFKKWQKYATKYTAINHIWLSDTTNLRKQLGIKGLPRMILLDTAGVIIDPDFPHLNNPLAGKWINSLLSENQNITASRKGNIEKSTRKKHD